MATRKRGAVEPQDDPGATTTPSEPGSAASAPAGGRFYRFTGEAAEVFPTLVRGDGAGVLVADPGCVVRTTVPLEHARFVELAADAPEASTFIPVSAAAPVDPAPQEA